MENGIVLNFDIRTLPSNLDNPSPSRFTLSAHDGAVSSIDVNPHLKGCIVTGGTDKQVKLWNINDEENGKRSISLVTSRDLGVVRLFFQTIRFLIFFFFLGGRSQGKVFSTVFSPDDPLTVAAAGSKAKLQIWDVGANFGARKAFGAKLREAGRTLREKAEGKGGGIIGVASDGEESEGDEE